MSFIRRTPPKFSHLLPKFLKSSDSPAIRLVKADWKLMFEVDKDVVQRSLDAEGISGECADKVTTIMKEAVEEISRDFIREHVVKIAEKNLNVPYAAVNYVVGAWSFSLSVGHWRDLLSKNHS